MTDRQDGDRDLSHIEYVSPCEQLESFTDASGPPPGIPRPDDARNFITDSPPKLEPVITDLIDLGDKLFIVAPSKSRKSFFTLHLALCIAAGRRFLAWDVPKPRRVLLIQYEIQKSHFHRRVKRMAQSAGLVAKDLTGDSGKGQLSILSLRGQKVSWKQITELAEGYDLILIDPFYKLLAEDGADENKASEVGRVLGKCDQLATKTKAAIGIVHHDPKGRAGDRANTDRGAGSGVMARDYDACIMLAPHRDEDEAAVVDAVLRNYPPIEPFVIGWEDCSFIVREDLEPIKETSSSAYNKTQAGPTVEEVAEWAFEASREPVNVGLLKTSIREAMKVGKNKCDEAVKKLVDRGERGRWQEGINHMIGPPESIPKQDTSSLPQ